MDSKCGGFGEGGHNEAGGRQCRVHFRVRAEGCGFGQTIAISGSSGALGNFDVRRVLPMVTTPEAYPVWYTEAPVVLPAGEALSYRYCILEGGAFKSFEEDAQAPRIITPISMDTVVENIINIAALDKSVGVETPVLHEGGGAAVVREVNPKQPQADSSNNDSAKSEDFGVQGSLYVVCYHLPLLIERTGTVPSFKVSWNDSIIARTDGAVADHVRMHWVGTPTVRGSSSQPLTEAEKSELTATLLLMDCIPVFIDSAVSHASYQGFCKEVLWPVFHNVDQLDCQASMWEGSNGGDNGQRQKGAFADSHTLWWEAYRKVNESIINVIMPRLHPHDIVWVHDYHLMLVPGMLRPATHAGVRIIFYLHIPFPTSQIFRSLPCASSIISSLGQADCIGFHTYQYTRHFLNAAKRTVGAVSRTLPGGMLAVAANGREVILSMAVVSIEAPVADKLLRLPDTVSRAAALRQKYAGKKIIASVEVCQRLSGGIFKLAGLECFLDDVWEEARRLDVVLVIRCIRTSSRLDDEKRTSEELRATANRLNEKYGRVVVDYEEVSEFTATDRAALWLASDVYFSTSIREALNMHPMEYIYCRKDEMTNPGVVIVSDMSASASLLSGSIKVNSFNTKQIADALVKALTMPAAEADRRRRRDLPYVLNHNASTWMREVIDDLQQGKQSLGLEKFNQLNRSAMSCQLQVRGLAASFARALHPDINPHLKRVFVFDFEGTLVSEELFVIYFKSSPAISDWTEPPVAVVEHIRKLAENPCNAVLIVCGIARAKFASVFNDLHNVSIATSNGLECSWGLNILSREELDNLSSAHAVDRAASVGMGQEEADDDFRSVDSFEPEDEHAEFLKLSIAETVTGGTMPQHHIHSAPAFDASILDHESRLIQKMTMFETHISSSSMGATSFAETYDIRESFDDAEEALASKTPRRMGKRNPRSRWEIIDPSYASIDWEAVKAVVLPILSKFTATTNGTCLVPRVPGLGWNFFNSEPDWGEKQCKQLRVELAAALSFFDVKVEVMAQGSLEIVPRSLRKGRVVENFLRRILSKRGGRWPTFCLVAGNDVLDEDMFKSAKNVFGSAPPQALPEPMALYTATVGKKRGSQADFFLRTQEEVEVVLGALVATDSSSSMP